MRYTLHFPDPGTVDHLGALASLAAGLHWKPADTHVYLINDAAGSTFLFATDGQVIRFQRFYLHRSAELCRTWAASLPIGAAPPCYGWIEDAENPEGFVQVDPVSRPLKLCSPVVRDSNKDRLATFEDADKSTADAGVLDQGFRHLRAFPEAFPAFPIVLGPQALFKFTDILAQADYHPPLAMVPEPQLDPQDQSRGQTWAKYFVYHARTLEPLGVILGARVPEFVQKVKAKR